MKIWDKYLIVRRDGSIPRWPAFVIGAADPVAGHTLRSYSLHGMAHDFEEDYLQSVIDHANDFDKWRQSNAIGDPCAGPHRTDDPMIVRAMTQKGIISISSIVPEIIRIR